MDLKLNNKTVIITGATGGIGKSIVEECLNEGCQVICFIRNKEKFEQLKLNLSDIKVDVNKLHSETCNILNKESIMVSIKNVLSNFKQIDVLVNCAGFAHEMPFSITTQEEIDLMIDLNLKTPMMLAQSVIKPMFKQRSGSIINITSASTIKKGRGIVAYASAKAGLEAFTRTLAMEIGRKNVRINSIRPGIIQTELSKGVTKLIGDDIKSFTSLNRFGKPKEIAKLVLFLASEESSSFITGETITADGGVY
jgi:3-oxoacyl-[acyl-carrier protein] reductase